MSNASEKIAFLRGLINGLKIKGDELAVYEAMIDVMDEIAGSLADIADSVEELEDEVEAIDDNLDDVIDAVEDLQDDFDDLAEDFDDIFDDDDDDEADDDDEELDGYIEFICPECGRHILFDIDSFNADEEHKCSCGAGLFADAGDEE